MRGLIVKRTIQTVGILLGGGLLGVFLLVLIFCIPISSQRRDEVRDLLRAEDGYPRALLNSPTNNSDFYKYYPDVLDNVTDCIVIMETALGDRGEGGILQQAMAGRMEEAEYSYYWHGNAVFWRPILKWLDPVDWRSLNIGLQLALVFLGLVLLVKKKGTGEAILWGSMYLLLGPMALGKSMQYSACFYPAMIGALLLLQKGDALCKKRKIWVVFLVLGMFTSYLDLLTFPLITWGIPCFWYIMTSEKNSRQYIGAVIESGLYWILGYACLWIEKWLFASVILKKNVVEEAVAEVFLRGGSGLDIGDRGMALFSNWRHYAVLPLALLLGLWLFAWLIRIWRKGSRESLRSPALGLMALSSPVWYFVVSEHTLLHHFFTYRIYVVGILAILGLMLESGWNGEDPIGDKAAGAILSKPRLRLIMGACISGVLALAGMLFLLRSVKEELEISNLSSESHGITLADGESMSADFVPAYDRIQKLDLVLLPENTDSVIYLSLGDEEGELYREEIKAEGMEGNYLELPVEWILTVGKPYDLKLEAVGGAYTIWLTNGPSHTHWQGMEIGGVRSEDTLLGKVFYDCFPPERGLKVFLLVSCWSIPMLLWVVFDRKKG